MNLFSTLKNKVKFGLSIMFLISLFVFGGISHAENDLLWQIWEPSYNPETVFNAGKNSNYVGRSIIHGSTSVDMEISILKKIPKESDGKIECTDSCTVTVNDAHGREQEIDCSDSSSKDRNEDYCKRVWKYTFVDVNVGKRPSLIVWITRALLTLVITLSVTMILYNGMKYIIETGQGKESKNLIKNVAYIVIGILISLFSVIIIALIQSTGKTIETEITTDTDNRIDKSALLMEAEKD